MRFSSRSLGLAVAIAIGTIVPSTPASSQAPVIARILSTRSTVTMHRAAPAWPEYTGRLRAFDELKAIDEHTAPRVYGFPFGNDEAANDNRVPAGITDADIKEMC